jgi:hypothetical protein
MLNAKRLLELIVIETVISGVYNTPFRKSSKPSLMKSLRYKTHNKKLIKEEEASMTRQGHQHFYVSLSCY